MARIFHLPTNIKRISSLSANRVPRYTINMSSFKDFKMPKDMLNVDVIKEVHEHFENLRKFAAALGDFNIRETHNYRETNQIHKYPVFFPPTLDLQDQLDSLREGPDNIYYSKTFPGVDTNDPGYKAQLNKEHEFSHKEAMKGSRDWYLLVVREDLFVYMLCSYQLEAETALIKEVETVLLKEECRTADMCSALKMLKNSCSVLKEQIRRRKAARPEIQGVFEKIQHREMNFDEASILMWRATRHRAGLASSESGESSESDA